MRMYLQRIRYRLQLSDRVRLLYDKFIVKGDLWSFLLEVDAEYRRFLSEKKAEEENAVTFISNVLEYKREQEERAMQVSVKVLCA